MKKLKPVKLIALGNATYCLISDETDWDEGWAFDTNKKEIIYYNGDYFDARPTFIKKLVAQHNEIGWVRHRTENSAFLAKFSNVVSTYVLPVLEFNNGNCFIEEEKIENQYVLKLPS